MKSKFAFVVVAAILVGCTTRPPPLRDARAGLSSSTVLEPGSTHEITVYVVKDGDNLKKIGALFGTMPREIKRLNPQLGFNQLRVGQALRVREQRIQ
jgi:LysM repeat protein